MGDWELEQALGLGIEGLALLIALIALFISFKAHKTSAVLATSMQETELTKMRIKAKDALAVAKRGYNEVTFECLENRKSWDKKHYASRMTLRAPSFELSDDAKLRRDVNLQAATSIQRLEQEYNKLNKTSLISLESFIGKATTVASTLQSLPQRLEEPNISSTVSWSKY